MDITSLYSGAAITATGSGSATIRPRGTSVNVGIVASAVSGTTPSATFEVQWSFDGTNWGSADAAADTFAAITTAKSVYKSVTVKAPLMRLAWTVSGTTPSFTIVASVAGC